MGRLKEKYINNLSKEEYEDAMEAYETIDSLTDDEPIPISIEPKEYKMDVKVDIVEFMVSVTKALEDNLKIIQALRERIVALEERSVNDKCSKG